MNILFSNRFWLSNLILVTFFWGTTFVLVKNAIADISVTWFLFYRFLFAFFLTLMLILVGLIIKEPQSLSINNVKKILTSKGLILGFFLYIQIQ